MELAAKHDRSASFDVLSGDSLGVCECTLGSKPVEAADFSWRAIKGTRTLSDVRKAQEVQNVAKDGEDAPGTRKILADLASATTFDSHFAQT